MTLSGLGFSASLMSTTLEAGSVAPTEMLQAMEEATYGVVILSPGFWESHWCMKELKTFVRRGRIVPVFYGGSKEVSAAADATMARKVWEKFERFQLDKDAY
jgi:hypothetical protein